MVQTNSLEKTHTKHALECCTMLSLYLEMTIMLECRLSRIDCLQSPLYPPMKQSNRYKNPLHQSTDLFDQCQSPQVHRGFKTDSHQRRRVRLVSSSSISERFHLSENSKTTRHLRSGWIFWFTISRVRSVSMLLFRVRIRSRI